MKKFVTLLLLVGSLALTACGGGLNDDERMATAIAYTQTYAAPTPMPEALQFAVAVEAVKATSAAIEATQVWIYGQQTATQNVKDEAATRQAAQVTQQAFIVESTTTARAFQAEQAATERSWNATVTSQVQGTATAYPMTSTALAFNATQTQVAWQSTGTSQAVQATQTQVAWQTTATMDAAYGWAQATAAYGDAESVNLAIERERVTNMTRAWVPWMAFVLALAFIIAIGFKLSKVRVIARDAFGALPGLVIDGRLHDPDRLPGPDAATTERAQIGQMVRSLPAGKTEPPAFMLPSAQPATPVVRLVDPSSVRDWVEDVSLQADEREEA